MGAAGNEVVLLATIPKSSQQGEDPECRSNIEAPFEHSLLCKSRIWWNFLPASQLPNPCSLGFGAGSALHRFAQLFWEPPETETSMPEYGPITQKSRIHVNGQGFLIRFLH